MKRKSSRVVFLQGKKTILRPLNKQTDLPSLTRWINDPEIRSFVLVYQPQMLESEEQWVDAIANNKRPNDIILAIETLDGRFIGTIGIHGISWKDRTATTGAIIGEKEFWGKGYGSDAKMALLDYAFNTLNLHKICSAVIAYNERSLNYSLHCGYKIEGRKRQQIFKNGAYHDEILLGIFKEEWLAAMKKHGKAERGK
jgi:RimJ/RimL family protein N-acetyltransferase